MKVHEVISILVKDKYADTFFLIINFSIYTYNGLDED